MQSKRRNTGEKCNPHGERGANRDGEAPDGTARSISEEDGITLRDHARQKGQNRPKLPHVSKMAKTFLPSEERAKMSALCASVVQNCRSPARLSARGEIVTTRESSASHEALHQQFVDRPREWREPTKARHRCRKAAQEARICGSADVVDFGKLLYGRLPTGAWSIALKRPVSFGYAELHRKIPARTPATWRTITSTNYKTGDGITRSVERRRDCGK